MKTMTIELLAVDLATCGRCTATKANLHEAIRLATPALAALGIRPEVKEVVVSTLDQAQQLRFASSPTIRIQGNDIASIKETTCEPCNELSGCGCDIACRVWPWQGADHEAAPLGLIVEALLRNALCVPPRNTDKWTGVPPNLERFFAAKSEVVTADAACCSPTCCQ